MNGAKKRNITFNPELTREFLNKLFAEQNKRCAISGMPIKFADTGKLSQKGEDTASLDRIDSNKPYEIGNVHWVHKVVNIMKGRLPLEEFVRWCKQITANQTGFENSDVPSDVYTQSNWLFGTPSDIT